MNQIKQKTSGFNIYDEIPLTELVPFKNHPYKVKDDAEMDALKKSIEESGVLVPAVARYNPHGDGYELIAGHRRFAACRALGFEKMPVIVFDGLTDEEAVIMMVDSNLQREHVPPSEKAFAYKMKMDAMRHQGMKTKETSRQVVGKSESADLISETESGRTVQRYIRLTYLIPEILQMVDDRKIALTPAVELSHLKKDEQQELFSIMECDEVTPSLSQAQRLRRMSEDGCLSDDEILSVLSEIKGNQKEYVRIPTETIQKYFHRDTSIKQMSDTLVKAMDFYNKHLERQRHDRDTR
ncbi:MAG: ParB/RepB/Spo0J family partition protein [Clostridia bacterium]|nr:ParB/RepB/Spo0J family partition protein [Clostridia bacterium]